MKKFHGVGFTVKYLKSCSVALQKYAGDDKLKSLRSLEPSLPFPRLISGLPHIICKEDRVSIMKGNTQVYKWWFTLFGLYRVFKAPVKPKLQTITDPFSGDSVRLSHIERWVWANAKTSLSFVNFKVRLLFEEMTLSKLSPYQYYFSNKSSPNNSKSWKGVFSDLWMWKQDPSLIFNYLDMIEAPLFKGFLTRTFKALDDHTDFLSIPKQNLQKGKFGFKEEAAGKLRVFAISDSLTQMVLQPLNEFIFEILRNLPNDGTFDQTSCIKRARTKSLNGVWSFDLSAATDRLPVTLQVAILSSIFGQDFSSWSDLLVKRDYLVPKNKYGIPESMVRYSVGQPMGALSSWAMLALTHHILLQMCARIVSHRTDTDIYSWNTDYEVLGDDIMIFDKEIANTYLILMKEIGVEINMSKSICSPNASALEFAKRTVFKGEDVSSLPWKLFLSCRASLQGKLALMTDLQTRDFKFNIKNTFACLASSEQDWDIIASGTKPWSKLSSSVLSSLRSFSKKLSLGYLSLLVIPFGDEHMPVRTMFMTLPKLLNGDSVDLEVTEISKRVLSPNVSDLAVDIEQSLMPCVDSFASLWHPEYITGLHQSLGITDIEKMPLVLKEWIPCCMPYLCPGEDTDNFYFHKDLSLLEASLMEQRMDNTSLFMNPSIEFHTKLRGFILTQLRMDLIDVVRAPQFVQHEEGWSLINQYILLSKMIENWDGYAQLSTKFIDSKRRKDISLEKSRPYPRWAQIVRKLSPNSYSFNSRSDEE